MKKGDIVTCKEIMRPTGVMGSTLVPTKIFDGFAIILSCRKNYTTVMKCNSDIISIKTSFLKVLNED